MVYNYLFIDPLTVLVNLVYSCYSGPKPSLWPGSSYNVGPREEQGIWCDTDNVWRARDSWGGVCGGQTTGVQRADEASKHKVRPGVPFYYSTYAKLKFKQQLCIFINLKKLIMSKPWKQISTHTKVSEKEKILFKP